MMGIEAQNEPLAWFENVDWESMAAQLTPTLRDLLAEAEELGGELGAEIAAVMEVLHFETNFSANGDEQPLEPPRPELETINDRLNEDLVRLLVEYEGIPEEEAQFARVEKWGVQTVASGCCRYQSCRKANGDWYTCGRCGNC